MSRLIHVLCWLGLLYVWPAVMPTLPVLAGLATPAAAQQPVKVWVNTKSGVYHCPGSRYFGTTKSGQFMAEAEARAAGNRPDRKSVV